MSTKKKKILLVEDDVELAISIKDIFEENQWDYFWAKNGHVGEFVSRLGHFDLILTDIRMPELDGLQMLEAIRRSKPSVPILVMTGFTQYTENMIAEKGADKVLYKPFTGTELIEVIKNHFAKSESLSHLKSA